MSRAPFHPLLLGAFPVLFLWSRNVGEVFPEDVWPVLGWVVAPTVVVLALASLLYRDLRRGALLTSIVALVALNYGRVGGDWHPVVGLALVVALLAVAAAGLHRLEGDALGNTTSIANVVAIALVATTLPPLASEAFADGGPSLDDLPVAGQVDGPVPDIFYIILDRYGREDSLREVFDYDNSEFIGFLEEHGFDVADQSLANYPKTAHSLAASLNMTYLDELESIPDERLDDWGPVYRLLDEHRVGRTLTELGYDYLHLGTWWSPTSKSSLATDVLTLDPSSEFSQVFRETTLLPAARTAVGATEEGLSGRPLIAAFSEYQLDLLERLATQDPDRPRFVFAHITLPHEPYVFEADGSFVPREVERARTRTENFVPQLEYTNTRIRGFVERLLADADHDAEPVVIVQADEGPHPEEKLRLGPERHNWLEAPLEDLREKLRILNAYHLPGVPDEEIPEDLSPVNTFRLVFSHYFGLDLPLLPDRTYVFPTEQRLYRFTDVTDRVAG